MLRRVNIAFMIIGFGLTVPFWLIAGFIQPTNQIEIFRMFKLITFTAISAFLATATTKLVFTYRNIL
jgi:hypothetical protein